MKTPQIAALPGMTPLGVRPEHWRFLPETDHKRAEVTTDDARPVAEILGDGRAQREQRGRLIAEAPALLAACKAALGAIEAGDPSMGERSRLIAAIVRAESGAS